MPAGILGRQPRPVNDYSRWDLQGDLTSSPGGFLGGQGQPNGPAPLGGIDRRRSPIREAADQTSELPPEVPRLSRRALQLKLAQDIIQGEVEVVGGDFAAVAGAGSDKAKRPNRAGDVS